MVNLNLPGSHCGPLGKNSPGCGRQSVVPPGCAGQAGNQEHSIKLTSPPPSTSLRPLSSFSTFCAGCYASPGMFAEAWPSTVIANCASSFRPFPYAPFPLFSIIFHPKGSQPRAGCLCPCGYLQQHHPFIRLCKQMIVFLLLYHLTYSSPQLCVVSIAIPFSETED